MTKEMLKRGLLVLTMMCGVLGMQAGEVTYNFLSSIPSPWTASAKPNGYEATGEYSRGTQFTTNATLTLSGVKDVTSVEIVCSSNESVNTLAVSVGGVKWGEVTLAKENHATKTFTGQSASGDLVITITRSKKSIWIEKVVVTGDVEGGNEGGDDNEEEEKLDENYKYGEPTAVKTPGALDSNIKYSFVQNNVRVSTTTGALTDTYFGCNAGQTITFETTRAMKGLVVEGLVKKGFSAEADNGDIEFLTDDEEDIDGGIVLAVKNIDSKTVSITCEKQMRCYGVEIYFDENPEVDLGGGEEGDYNFDWEPEEKSTFNLVFDEIDYEDYSEYLGYNCVNIYLDNDDFELELMVFAPVAEGTVLAPGTYEISDSYEEGTVQASPGGDDEYDYPAVLMTGFTYYEDYDAWVYDTCYYLESGTLKVEVVEGGYQMTIDATSHYGSTLHGVFTCGEGTYGIETPQADVNETSSKVLLNGQVVIRHQGKHYSVNGVERNE